MDDGADVAARLVDFAMDEALDVHQATLLVDRIGIEIKFHDVFGDDRRRRLGSERR